MCHTVKYSGHARNDTHGNKYNVILNFSSVLLFWLLGSLCSSRSDWLNKEVTKCVRQLFVMMILFKRLNSVQTTIIRVTMGNWNALTTGYLSKSPCNWLCHLLLFSVAVVSLRENTTACSRVSSGFLQYRWKQSFNALRFVSGWHPLLESCQ